MVDIREWLARDGYVAGGSKAPGLFLHTNNSIPQRVHPMLRPFAVLAAAIALATVSIRSVDFGSARGAGPAVARLMAMGIGAAEEVCAVLRGEQPRWLANRDVWEKRRR